MIKKYVHFKISGWGKEYNKTVTRLYSAIYEYCYKYDQNKMVEMAMKNFSFAKSGITIDVTNNIDNKNKMRQKFQIFNSKIWVYTKYNNPTKFKNLLRLIKYFDLNPEDILIEIPNTNLND